MENNLIPITTASIGGDQQQGVNARDLHQFLEVGKDFSNWIKDRINQFDFVEGVDFVKTQDLSSPNLANAKSRAQVRIEYILTLNMAKELSMVERNEKGKQARQYFIQCEKLAKEPVNALLAMSKSEILLMAAETQKKNEALEAKTLQLENKIEEDAPKVEFADGVIATGKCICLREAIKACGVKPMAGFDWLRSHKFIYKQGNQATQKSIDMGLMVVRFANVPHVEGVEQKPYAHVTGKGLVYFRKKFVEAGLVLSNPNLEMRI